jgi:hypothetical protein
MHRHTVARQRQGWPGTPCINAVGAEAVFLRGAAIVPSGCWRR